jgi:hypothetical protein
LSSGQTDDPARQPPLLSTDFGNPSENGKPSPTLQKEDLMKYKVTFMDGTKTKVKANSKAEARSKAESGHNKPVLKVKEYGEES